MLTLGPERHNMVNGGAGGQRGAASDPRHGKARAEASTGAYSGGLLRQTAFVVIVVLAVLGVLALTLILFFDPTSGSSSLRYIAAAVLGALLIAAMVVVVIRGRRRPSLEEALKKRTR
jgi:uncharacterized integral membrane protein